VPPSSVGFPNVFLDSLGLSRLELIVESTRPVRPSPIAALRRRSSDKDHVWASRSYVSERGRKHGAVITIHLPRKLAQGPIIVEVEYRAEDNPRTSDLPFSEVWAAAQSLVRRPKKMFVAAAADLTQDQVRSLPFELPRSLPNVPADHQVVGLQINRKSEDKLLYTLSLQYPEEKTCTATVFFTREASNLGDAPFLMATAASNLIQSIVRGAK